MSDTKQTIVLTLVVTCFILLVSWPYWCPLPRRATTWNHVKGFFAASHQTGQPDHESPAEACKAIITGESFVDGRKNLLTAVQSRAGANQRLTRVFGINNSFTTEDDEYRRSFRNMAAKRLVLNAAAWCNLESKAQKFVDGFVANSKNTLMLAQLASQLSFRLTLNFLWSVDVLEVDSDAVDVATTAINDLWMASKAEGDNSRFEDCAELRQALTTLIPGCSFDDNNNPLNLIIPAFESLWRMALSGFLEIAYATELQERFRKTTDMARTAALRRATIHKATLRKFLQDPSVAVAQLPQVAGVTAFDVARESLRLYPTTKRVHRHFQSADEEAPTQISADVEKIHRSEDIWGETSEDFDASRWAPGRLTAVQKDSYMPFALHPFECPAKRDFGLRMLALLIGTMVRGVGSEWELEIDWLYDDYYASIPSDRATVNNWTACKVGVKATSNKA